jgi:uncharacterized repeat protein (TIGR03803 family)
MRNRKLSLGLAATLAIFFTALLMLGTPAAAQTEQALHNFSDSGDGAAPTASLISDSSGNLYGTTSSGGAAYQNLGAVFEVTPVAGGGWTETLLYSFSGDTDGVWPIGGLVRDGTGNLFGTTAYGGGESATYCGQGGCGTVFELSPAAGGGWTEKVLHRFSHNGKDGVVPYASLVVDAVGNLYGTTLTGGAYDEGTVFELTRKSGGWAENVLHSFKNNVEDGQVPESSLLFDTAGNLYGTTANGGAHNYGTVFELSRKSGGGWAEKILHSFNDNGTDGFTPAAGLILDAAGNLYGTTAAGGSSKSCVNFQLPTCGTVFEVARKAGGVWLEKVLYDFDADTSGANPLFGSLVVDAAGDLYGTTSQGGYSSSGTVFELTRAADGGWTETTLHLFGSGADGQNPDAGLIFGADGNLYGTTFTGGTGFQGTVFEITP